MSDKPSNKPSQQSINAFVRAAANGDHDELVKFLDIHGPRIINEKNSFGNTALVIASRWGLIDIVALLLERGADIHVACEDKETALMVAEKHKKHEVAAFLRQWPVMQKQKAERQKRKEHADKLLNSDPEPLTTLFQTRIKKLKKRSREKPFPKKPKHP